MITSFTKSLTMFTIHETITLKNATELSPSDYITNDFADSSASNQLKRVFNRPLETRDSSNRNFTSWKGRSVCLVKFCHNLIREPFRFLKNIVVIMILSLNALLSAINAPFSKSARMGLGVSLLAPFSSTAGLIIRPIGFATDMIKLSYGFIIHPSIAIRLNQ